MTSGPLSPILFVLRQYPVLHGHPEDHIIINVTCVSGIYHGKNITNIANKSLHKPLFIAAVL